MTLAEILQYLWQKDSTIYILQQRHCTEVISRITGRHVENTGLATALEDAYKEWSKMDDVQNTTYRH